MKMKSYLACGSICLALASTGALAGDRQESAGMVYTMNNNAADNHVLIFNRGEHGALTYTGELSTQGRGTGASLGSQGGLIVDLKNELLLAVNAGSDDITVFAVRRHGLAFVGRYSSGGRNPISLTLSDGILYVLNAGASRGDADQITGFDLSNGGRLKPIKHSTRGLSGTAVAPAQIGFSPDGNILVVTEKGTQKIDTFAVDSDGLASNHKTFTSPGQTPFGFAFGKRHQLFVTEAFGGMANASAVSSLAWSRHGELEVISASVPTHQTAACWMAVSEDGRYAYDTNTGSDSVTGFDVDDDGTIRLLNADGRTGLTESTPIDLAFSADGRFLYNLNRGGTISSFTVRADGRLRKEASISIPGDAAGLAVW